MNLFDVSKIDRFIGVLIVRYFLFLFRVLDAVDLVVRWLIILEVASGGRPDNLRDRRGVEAILIVESKWINMSMSW